MSPAVVDALEALWALAVVPAIPMAGVVAVKLEAKETPLFGMYAAGVLIVGWVAGPLTWVVALVVSVWLSWRSAVMLLAKPPTPPPDPAPVTNGSYRGTS